MLSGERRVPPSCLHPSAFNPSAFNPSPFNPSPLTLHYQESVAFLCRPQSLPNPRMLVVHRTGSGKTATMIQIADNYFLDRRPKVHCVITRSPTHSPTHPPNPPAHSLNDWNDVTGMT